MSLVNILDFTPEELKKKFQELGLEPYRADQVLQWIYSKGVYDFDRMTNLSLTARGKLKTIFSFSIPKEAERQKSHDDDSIKLLLKLNDDDLVETVFMPAIKASADFQPAKNRGARLPDGQVAQERSRVSTWRSPARRIPARSRCVSRDRHDA